MLNSSIPSAARGDLVVYAEQGYTTRQPGILCGWSGRLEQSTTEHSFGTYITNVQKRAQDTSVLSFLLHWLTVSRVQAANIVRRRYSDSSHVNAPSKLSFYYYYFFIYQGKTPGGSKITKENYETCLEVNPTLAGRH